MLGKRFIFFVKFYIYGFIDFFLFIFGLAALPEVFLLGVLILVGFYFLTRHIVRLCKRNRIEEKEAKLQKMDRRYEQGKDICSFGASIVYGLPVPEGTVVKTVLSRDGLRMVVSKDVTYTIPMNRIIGANSMVKKDVVQTIKSDYGKAAFGGLLFGDAGAIIGGMPESRFTNRYTTLYVFAYKTKENEDATMIFMADFEFEADKMINYIKRLKPVDEGSKVIEL